MSSSPFMSGKDQQRDERYLPSQTRCQGVLDRIHRGTELVERIRLPLPAVWGQQLPLSAPETVAASLDLDADPGQAFHKYQEVQLPTLPAGADLVEGPPRDLAISQLPVDPQLGTPHRVPAAVIGEFRAYLQVSYSLNVVLHRHFRGRKKAGLIIQPGPSVRCCLSVPEGYSLLENSSITLALWAATVRSVRGVSLGEWS